MKCLRCGYCCLNHLVVVVADPEKGITEDNCLVINSINGLKCPHLRGNSPGNYICAIHDYPWYEDTPCFEHAQFEYKDTKCRIGEHQLKCL